MGDGPKYTSCSSKVESPEPVTDDLIRQLATLAGLRVDDSELPELRRQMQEMIAMVGSLPIPEPIVGSLPIPEPGVELSEPEMRLRADVPRAGLARPVVLDLATQTSDGLIVVPSVLERSRDDGH